MTLVWFYALILNPLVAVDCGSPDIPQGGILQLVGSDRTHTQYKDSIQFHCVSLYYTLEGDGKYKTLACIHFYPQVTVNIYIFYSFRYLQLRCQW